jgi:hypothetical protein
MRSIFIISISFYTYSGYLTYDLSFYDTNFIYQIFYQKKPVVTLIVTSVLLYNKVIAYCDLILKMTT